MTLLHFSLKEAIYKALHPHLQRYVGFDEASLELDVDGEARATLHLKEDPPQPLQVELSYLWLVSHVVSIARVSTRARGRRRSGGGRGRGRGASKPAGDDPR